MEGNKNKMMDECLSAALQLSSAMKYLHKHSIIFRDMKPENIGFDVRGDLKIFDFGFARFMTGGDNPYNDAYKISVAGTPRYMAPECLSGKAYNLKADVYTFAIVLWEMLSGESAYSFVSDRDHLQNYVVDRCGRPEINEIWPDHIKGMLEDSFDADMDARPEMKVHCHIIRKELSSLRGGDMTGLTRADMKRRRTTDSIRRIQAELESLRG
eukprot:CAMPEP_0196159560 /NCGR_PEP_ID=MMETSP0910-20130528/46385_1 /TAXON_ID=49265 /ORGANISM="Thalassiosira rotula, Strain GSO102" /LENGTH=211 /DNA_ID=CAMNT_0041424483 /DNA_START=1079 /DNA_END=1714 /DNA_ORIENTATION=+